MSELLSRCAAATTGGGIVAIGALADRRELLSDGSTRRAEVGFELSAEQALQILDEVFAGWSVERRSVRPTSVAERRGPQEYALRAEGVCAAVIARAVHRTQTTLLTAEQKRAAPPPTFIYSRVQPRS